MGSNLEFIKTLTETLISELDELNIEEDLIEKGDFNLDEKVQEFEIELIKAALVKTGGNQSRAAELLGLPISTLNNKIKNCDIKYSRSSKPRDYFR